MFDLEGIKQKDLKSKNSRKDAVKETETIQSLNGTHISLTQI